MGARRLSPAATAYVWAVIVCGSAATAWLVATAGAERWSWPAIVLFGSLGILASAVSLSYQGSLPSTIVHQIGTSFAYALFLIADPAAVCFVLMAMAVTDGLLNRRRRLTVAFNMAQLAVALGAAVSVRFLALHGSGRLDVLHWESLLVALASLEAFSLANHLLTHIVVSLASRRRILRSDLGTRTGALNEVFCIVSGLSMGVLWNVDPRLSPVGIVPIWSVILLMVLLSRREQELENRQGELTSLQGLGLEIGSELDGERLRHSVVRIVSEALQASSAVLGTLEPSREQVLVRAHHGLPAPPPERLKLSGLAGGFFESRAIVAVGSSPDERERYPELAFLDAAGVLCAPLEILGKREGLLLIAHGAGRRAFDDNDVARLQSLVRFVDMALSNAQLVTDLKQMQEQLHQSEKMSALGMLVSGVAHELNNPLTAVLGYTQLLLGRDTDPRRTRMLRKVRAEAERAGRIVQNLLTFSRTHKPERTRVDLNRVVEQVLDLKDYELRVRNIELVRRLAPELPPVLVDVHQMHQVLLNLLTNAQQAIEDTGRSPRIVIETGARDDRVRLIVSDNGTGTPQADLAKVFLPFFTTKEVGRGTGLGLSICYGIVEEHGGTIRAESSPDKGATFVVEIPAAGPVEQAGPGAADTAGEAPAVAGAGRLLVVDDEESITELVRDVLEPQGWLVRAAQDGSQALGMVAESDYDVLLVDMRMPGMDGRSFFEALRASRPDLARRVVFATGDAGSVSTAEFLRDTGSPVLGKPYDLGALLETVSRVAETPARA